MRAVNVIISGQVQGVGYRYWCYEQANKLGISGWVRNLKSGEVEAEFCGTSDNVNQMIKLCEVGPRWANVTTVTVSSAELSATQAFEILATEY